ncbi:MAG: IS5 family transposase [Gammaproteobacteria bacterium]|nr:IS5 family transposase [Gammaproteobacteria bacterium]
MRNDQWARIEPMLPGKAGDRGRTAKDNRLFVDAVLWIARAGAPWRDLPEAFGPWNSVYKRFSRWSNAGVWHRVFAELAQDADFEEVFLDSTIVRAHQHAAGAPKKNGSQAIGRSRGGLTTKIHALVEGLGNLARWQLTAGQIHDITQAHDLIEGVPAQTSAIISRLSAEQTGSGH